MFNLNHNRAEFIGNRVSHDDSYDCVHTYQQQVSERNRYDLLFELAYPLICSLLLSFAITSTAAIQAYFSLRLLVVSFCFSASALYLVIYVLHATKAVSYSESEKYKQIAKSETRGEAVQSQSTVLKTIRLDMSHTEGGYARLRRIDFPNIDDSQLLKIAVHCLRNNNSFSKHSLSNIVSTTAYPQLVETFSSAGLIREIDNRGTKELTPSGRSILNKYIEAV